MIQFQIRKDNKLLITADGLREDIIATYGARRTKDGYVMAARLSDLELMSSDGFEVQPAEDDATQEWLVAARKSQALSLYLAKAGALRRESVHPRWTELMPHQHVGTAFLATHPRAILGYSPRLGKTVCSVVAADILNKKKILVVTPLTIFGTWERGIKRWASDPEPQVQISHGKYKPTDSRWVITNPDSIRLRVDEYLKEDWDLVILDESLVYKNHSSRRQQAAVKLGRAVDTVWLLTGNPTGAYADQLFGQLQILRPDVFTSYWRFARRWCTVINGTWGDEVVGNKNPDGLRKYLADLMLSRTPLEVPGLPELEFETIEVELTDEQEELINEIETTMGWTISTDGAADSRRDITSELTVLLRIAQAVSCPRTLGIDQDGAKAAKALELIENGNGPYLIWFQFRKSLDSFAKLCRAKRLRVGEVHGGIGERDRNKTISSFQSGNIDVICVQLDTGKFGLDLTRAQTIIYHDRGYDLDSWVQSTNRTRVLGMETAGAGYVLHGGHSDFVIDSIIKRKVTSLRQMSLTDLMEMTARTTARKKPRKSNKEKK